jgi:lysozyme
VIDEAVDVACAIATPFEGFRAKPYLCPAGVWTSGYGVTVYPDGTKVQPTDAPVTKEAARTMLEHLIRARYLPGVLLLCPHIDTAGRLGAMTDFAYNLGLGNLKTSTLRKKINAEEWEKVPEQLRRWTRGGGKVLRGLVLRRETEIAYI